jgi:hypothetical protein
VLRPQVKVHIGLVVDQPGGCEVTFEALPDSPLVAKYGGVIATLAACRDFMVRDLDDLIASFVDEPI